MTRTVTIWVLFLTLFALLTWFCISRHAAKISSDISTRANEALDTAGYANIQVQRVDGLHVVLTGNLSSKAQGDSAVSLVRELRGVRSVQANFNSDDNAPTDASLVDATSPPDVTTPSVSKPLTPKFSAAHDGQTITVSGTVNNGAARASLVGAARRTFANQRVVDELIETSGMPEGWSDQLRLGMTALAGLKSGKLDITSKYLSLVGSAQTGQAKEAAERQIEAMATSQQRVRLDVAVLSANSVDATACQSSLDRLLESKTIQFKLGSDVISVDSYPLLEELADAIARCDNVNVEVQGHTDSSGDVQVNQRLSELRAQSVVNYLVDEGIRIDKLNSVGLGSTQPVGDNNTARGRALNRRIEFVTTGN